MELLPLFSWSSNIIFFLLFISFQGNTPEHWQQTAELCHACNFPILFYHTAAVYIHSSIQPKLAHSRILLGGQRIKVNTRANAHKRNTQRIIGKKAHTKFAFWPEKQERKKESREWNFFEQSTIAHTSENYPILRRRCSPPNSNVMPRVIWAQNTIEDSFTFFSDFGVSAHTSSSNVEYE